MMLRHLASIVTLPVTVIIILPFLLVYFLPYVPFWGLAIQTAMLLLFAGMILTGLGFVLLYSTISLFIRERKGTIAPWDPTKKLVVTGVYAYVRNPMIIGVYLILAGESMLSGSMPMVLWTLLFFLGNLIYIPLVEERSLENRFGDDYRVYKRNVPRWIPRLSSWKSNTQTLDL